MNMITSKQRAFLRAQANTLEPVYYVGKEGISADLARGVGQALEARELIKLSVQESCPISCREVAGELAELCNAEPIQVIGRRLVLYRRNPKLDAYGI